MTSNSEQDGLNGIIPKQALVLIKVLTSAFLIHMENLHDTVLCCNYNSEEKVEQNEPFLRGDVTYCFGLHWHSVQLESLKQHENMAFLFLICSKPSRAACVFLPRNNHNLPTPDFLHSIVLDHDLQRYVNSR